MNALQRLACRIGAITVLLAATALAHDTWVQTNTRIVRVGDVVYVDLMLGNHGNNHRDFKLAGKASLDDGTLVAIAPDGRETDLKPAAVDQGLAPKEGYWTARFQPREPGLYLVAQTSDKVVSYAPKRSIKSAKTFFVAGPALDELPAGLRGFDRILGHPLELVPRINPVMPTGLQAEIAVQLLYKGKPLGGATVSFIPRGQVLAEGFDERYERISDEQGMASFTPTEANYYLVVAHQQDPDGKGEGYTTTSYSATLTVLVPGAP